VLVELHAMCNTIWYLWQLSSIHWSLRKTASSICTEWENKKKSKFPE